MLIDKMENRILVGLVMFVGIMLLVGWVAINENARMASFERQYLARSIERGAELFANNCSTCHATDGRGIAGRAPALNSPHFFGYDYLAAATAEIAVLRAEESALNAERLALADELTSPDTTEERQAEIQERLAEIQERLNGAEGIPVELTAALEARAEIAQQLQPAILRGYPLEMAGLEIASTTDSAGNEVIAYQPSRLAQIAWPGTLENFISTTLVHGRPTSISYWNGNQMAAWSQRAGGPLRDDQIQDLTNYILNWDKGDNWTIADAVSVDQYAIVPGLGGGESDVEVAGTDVDAIVTALEDVTGDATRGEAIYSGADITEAGAILGCAGCHNGAVNGPATAEKWDLAHGVRLDDPALEGYGPIEYLVESIVAPNEYIVEGWPSGQMLGVYGQQMTVQDMADVLAYLETFSEGSE
jgi:mono/diheme cytochrome c family protein